MLYCVQRCIISVKSQCRLMCEDYITQTSNILRYVLVFCLHIICHEHSTTRFFCVANVPYSSKSSHFYHNAFKIYHIKGENKQRSMISLLEFQFCLLVCLFVCVLFYVPLYGDRGGASVVFYGLI